MNPQDKIKTYGYDPADWDQAKLEMRNILGEVAKEPGRTIAYSDLVAKIDVIELHPQSPALAGMLEQISNEEEAAGRGMLSVIVVHKSGDMRPGRGFFDLAQRLGRNISDEDSVWIEEMKRVNAIWRD